MFPPGAVVLFVLFAQPVGIAATSSIMPSLEVCNNVGLNLAITVRDDAKAIGVQRLAIWWCVGPDGGAK